MPEKSTRPLRTEHSAAHIRPMKVLSSEYATFRPDVQEYIIERILRHHSVLLDPMAGTSPLIPYLETHGYTAYLNDISPVHFYVNRAKQYRVFRRYKEHGYEWFLSELLCCMASLRGKYLCMSHKWIADEVLSSLVRAWRATEEYDEYEEILLKAIIVISVRTFSSFTASDNPTWFKPGGISSKKSLQEIIRQGLSTFDRYYSHFYPSLSVLKRGRCILSIQDAAQLNLKQKVDCILTSPQYCNRLDSTRQYAPELYFLSTVGHTAPENAVLGTTKVRDYDSFESDLEYLRNNSECARRLLSKIKKSPKTDDPRYYLKYYTRYFSMLHKTFKRLTDYLSLEGRMYIIVQDNTHRGQDIEIDKILRELLKRDGWRSQVRILGERHHLGLRNPSRDHAFIKRKQFEKLLVMWR